MDCQTQGTGAEFGTNVTMGFGGHDQAMVCCRSDRPSVGKAMKRFHRSIFSAEQLRIWRACSRLTSQWDAYLAGGTAVALHLGHRRSNHFDWFTPKSLPSSKLLADIESLGFPLTVRQNTEGTFLAMVSNVTFSVFRYRYPLLDRPGVLDGCAVASIRDLAAMKLLAIYQRGTKKDFVDMHALLETGYLTLGDMFAAFREKFGIDDTSEVVRALAYFGDTDELPMPHMLSGRTWEEVKHGLLRHKDGLHEPGRPSRRRS